MPTQICNQTQTHRTPKPGFEHRPRKTYLEELENRLRRDRKQTSKNSNTDLEELEQLEYELEQIKQQTSKSSETYLEELEKQTTQSSKTDL
eukprot:15287787-Heterocapsa_arctica.AAC.1